MHISPFDIPILKQWQVKMSGWNNTQIWKAKGKAMDINTGENPGYHSQS